MKKPVEIIEGNKSLRLNLYIIIATYLLIIVLLESAIDLLVLSLFNKNIIVSIEQMNQVKLMVSSLSYVALGLIPGLFGSWYGYRIIASAKLPPVIKSGKSYFPFTVAVIKNKQAKMFGVLLVIVSLVLIFQLLLYLLNVMIT